MSRDRDDKLQRAKDALKSALAALETLSSCTLNPLTYMEGDKGQIVVQLGRKSFWEDIGRIWQ